MSQNQFDRSAQILWDEMTEESRSLARSAFDKDPSYAYERYEKTFIESGGAKLDAPLLWIALIPYLKGVVSS